MVVDGAGWHKAKSLRIPGNLRLIALPPYAPELNPVERLWDELREKCFLKRVFDSMDVLENHLEMSLRRCRFGDVASEMSLRRCRFGDVASGNGKQ
jgi:hypothetical protein